MAMNFKAIPETEVLAPEVSLDDMKVKKHQELATLIVKKLAGLGIKEVAIKRVIDGPVVTGFPLTLGNSVPMNKILPKAEDLALACGVESVVIERIGKELVVFVPNSDRVIVDFKDALFWYLKDEQVGQMKLPLLLGMNHRGEKCAIDLAEQPHVLIAGSTGSGKSVFETNLIAALSTHKSPDELKLYLVDTKRVDLTLFEKLPHVKETAKDVEDWYLLINGLHHQVQSRNKLFELLSVRNIAEFNKKKLGLDCQEDVLPYIVLVIDELADLIEKDKEERAKYGGKDKDCPEPKVIDALKRLIQICRASGVHVIACTQRTSVDIITGTVKANFPTRISLRLPASQDSRTILGESGAENLLGKGDMLLKRNESDSLERYHGPFVDLNDIETILEQQDMIRSMK